MSIKKGAAIFQDEKKWISTKIFTIIYFFNWYKIPIKLIDYNLWHCLKGLSNAIVLKCGSPIGNNCVTWGDMTDPKSQDGDFTRSPQGDSDDSKVWEVPILRLFLPPSFCPISCVFVKEIVCLPSWWLIVFDSWIRLKNALELGKHIVSMKVFLEKIDMQVSELTPHPRPWDRLALNFPSSCLGLLSTEITGMQYCSL